jgi:hypothetical protein
MLVMVTGVVPSVYVTFQGPVPVKVKLRVADCPFNIVVDPLNTAVGLGFTVTEALPLKSAGNDAHLLSLTAVNV